jgi:putative intracellular protease/amidase
MLENLTFAVLLEEGTNPIEFDFARLRLKEAGAVVSEGKRVVRDGCIITAIFPRDLPAFFQMILVAVSEAEHRTLPVVYPARLVEQRWGIVVDDASDSVQVHYLRLRISEEGGKHIILGREVGANVRLSSPAWEWGQFGSSIQTDRGLPDPGVVSSCDTEADLNSLSVTANELDGLILPGGLATWMIRGHSGLRRLIEEMNDRGKPLCAIGRGAKLLFMTSALEGRTITCAPQMKDDIIHAIYPVEYSDKPAERDGNLLTCQGSEYLPEMMQLLLAAYGGSPRVFLRPETG